MPTIIKDTKKEFPKASEGQHVAICVDFIGPWRAVDDFDPKKPYLVQKCAYVWQIDEQRQDLKPFELAREFTMSFGPKANLRRFIGQWRGKEITDQEAKGQGIDLEAFVGKPGLLTVQHREKRAGGIRVEVSSIIPLPKQIGAISASAYTRAEYWAKRIAEDEDQATRLEQEQMAAGAAQQERFQDIPAALQEPESDSDLPF